jgi:hypothetical protein
MGNFSQPQTADNNVKKSKLTLDDLQAFRRKSNKTFIKNREDDY